MGTTVSPIPFLSYWPVFIRLNSTGHVQNSRSNSRSSISMFSRCWFDFRPLWSFKDSWLRLRLRSVVNRQSTALLLMAIMEYRRHADYILMPQGRLTSPNQTPHTLPVNQPAITCTSLRFTFLLTFDDPLCDGILLKQGLWFVVVLPTLIECTDCKSEHRLNYQSVHAKCKCDLALASLSDCHTVPLPPLTFLFLLELSQYRLKLFYFTQYRGPHYNMLHLFMINTNNGLAFI